MSNVGRLIHRERLLKDLSIKQVAIAVEKSPGYIGDIEHGRLSGSPDVLRAIAALLSISEHRMRDAYTSDAFDNAARLWVEYPKRKREYRGQTENANATL